MKGILHEDQHIFVNTSHSGLLRMRNVSDKVVKKIKTRTLFVIITFFKIVHCMIPCGKIF
jgi:hypothetical protein